MTTGTSNPNDPGHDWLSPRGLVWTAGLAGLAVLGNVSNLPLFFSVSFIFGSVAALVTLRLFGLVPGVIVALIGGSYTWILWGHPYAMVIFTVEALVVGLLIKRVQHLPVADFIYWVFVGAPLVMLFYWVQLGMAGNAAGLIALKQPINGIFNAVIAALILMAVRFYGSSDRSQGNLGSIVFNAMLLVTILAGTVPIVLDSIAKRVQEERIVERHLADTSQWITGELSALYPNLDAFRSDTSGVRRVMERIATSAPGGEALGFSLIDSDGAVIGGRGEMLSTSGDGTQSTLPSGLMIWQPSGDMASMLRWRQSFYIFENAVYESEEVPKVVVEYAAEPVVGRLDSEHFRLLSVLAVVIVLALLTSTLISYWLTRPIRQLSDISGNLMTTVTSGDAETVEFPRSRIYEFDELGTGLRYASRSLTSSFQELRAVKNSLEDRVRERTRDLERLSMVASQTNNAVIITDLDGRTEWVNEGFTRITEYKPDEVIGRKPGDVLQGPDSDPETIKIMRDAIADHKPFNTQVVNYTKSGRAYWLEISCNPMRNSDGEVEGFIAIESDVTERKILEHSKDEFISTVSHELRTPLTSIKGSLSLALNGAFGDLPFQLKGGLDIAHRNADRLIHLVNDILDVQKLQSGAVDLEVRQVDLLELLQNAVTANQSYAQQHGVELILGDVPAGTLVSGDEHRLTQVLANLLSNAAKFSPNGGSVDIHASVDGDMARVFVADQGPGIPVEYQEHIFERFSQVDSSDTREKGGTGLGLNISKTLMQMHGGAIGLESIPGEGTTFHIDIPLAAVS